MPKISNIPIDLSAPAVAKGELNIESDEDNKVEVSIKYKMWNEDSGKQDGPFVMVLLKFDKDAFLIWCRQCIEELK